MKLLDSNKGMALITALMLTLIGLTMILSLLYIVSQNISASGAQKRYESSLEAAHGGVDILSREIIPRLFKGDSVADITGNYNTMLSTYMSIPSSLCLNDKLTKKRSEWTNCSTDSADIDAKKSFDVSLTLKNVDLAQPGFTVYSKITDTAPGNTDNSGIDYLENGASVTAAGTGANPKHIPYMYRIEVQGESESNAKERAKLSVLYAY
ncbi:MAG: pilus assembly protein PilX [Geobacteraceae bacterium]|nr:pilus assembly protein PilX [Geobacteraceae bacterium]